MEVLRHFHPFFDFPGAWRVFGEKRQGSRKGLAPSSLCRSAGLPASSMARRRKAGEAFPALVGFSVPGRKSMPGGASSGFERMPGLFRENIAVEDSRRFCGAGPGGSGRRQRVCADPGSGFAPPGRKKRFIFVHPAPSALWTGPDEDLFNTGTAFAPQVGARRRQRPGAEFGSVNHSPQHGRNPCSCIIP